MFCKMAFGKTSFLTNAIYTPGCEQCGGAAGGRADLLGSTLDPDDDAFAVFVMDFVVLIYNKIQLFILSFTVIFCL